MNYSWYESANWIIITTSSITRMIVSLKMLFLPNLQTDNKIDKYGHNADDDWCRGIVGPRENKRW